MLAKELLGHILTSLIEDEGWCQGRRGTSTGREWGEPGSESEDSAEDGLLVRAARASVRGGDGAEDGRLVKAVGVLTVGESGTSLDDAENPLQLLARTSELLSSITPQSQGAGAARLPSKSTSSRGLAGEGDDLQKFFGRFQPRLDVGEDLDPIELGLITLTEAEVLFS